MSHTILVIDDDDVLAGVLKRVLTRQGLHVVTAATAREAVELARLHRPQLALLDLCLPDGDGVHLAANLRAEFADIVLILMTAYPLRLRAEPELAHEFACVLVKPLDLGELRQAVSAAGTLV